jgi:tRNA dimethylallyltransferase
LYKLLTRLDPVRAERLNPNDRYRVGRALEIRVLLGEPAHAVQGCSKSQEDQALIIYLNPERGLLRSRIAQRAEQMLADGLMDEVAKLMAGGCPANAKPMQSIGYRQACDYLQNPLAKAALLEEIFKSTCQYAKRQRTWFNKVRADRVLHEAHLTTDLSALISTRLPEYVKIN